MGRREGGFLVAWLLLSFPAWCIFILARIQAALFAQFQISSWEVGTGLKKCPYSRPLQIRCRYGVLEIQKHISNLN